MPPNQQILLFTFLRRKSTFKSEENFINLIIVLPETAKYNFDEIIETISRFTNYITLKRFSKDSKNVESSLYLGIITGIITFYAVYFKSKVNLDDALDVYQCSYKKCLTHHLQTISNF